MRWRGVRTTSWCRAFTDLGARDGGAARRAAGRLAAHPAGAGRPRLPPTRRWPPACTSSRSTTRARPGSWACSSMPAARRASPPCRCGPPCRTTWPSRPARRPPWRCSAAWRTCWTCRCRSATCREEARAWERGVDELAEQDTEVADYVRTLEEAKDATDLPEASGDAIAREFERYLRRRGTAATAAAAGRSRLHRRPGDRGPVLRRVGVHPALEQQLDPLPGRGHLVRRSATRQLGGQRPAVQLGLQPGPALPAPGRAACCPRHCQSTVRSLYSSPKQTPWSQPYSRPSPTGSRWPILRSALFTTASKTAMSRSPGWSRLRASATRSYRGVGVDPELAHAGAERAVPDTRWAAPGSSPRPGTPRRRPPPGRPGCPAGSPTAAAPRPPACTRRPPRPSRALTVQYRVALDATTSRPSTSRLALGQQLQGGRVPSGGRPGAPGRPTRRDSAAVHGTGGTRCSATRFSHY